MKKIISLCSLAVLLILQLHVAAQDNNDSKKKFEFSQSKKINKSYSVSSSEKLSIDNKFGSVEIHTWNKNEIKIDIEITVSAKTQDWANSVLGDIDVEDNRAGNTINVKTLFAEDMDKKEGRKNDRQAKYHNSNSSQNMDVNYSVYMPATNPLRVSNEFGATIIPDFKGEVDLTSKFGSLKTGVLSAIKNITVEFGKGTFESLTNGNIVMKYSKGEFGKLTGDVKLNLEFCSSTKLSFDNSISALDIKASYSTINLRPAGEPSVSYTIATSFGSFKNRSGVKFDSDEDKNGGPKFDYNYSGRSGSGTIPVKVKSNFSKVILGEATEEDMKEKKKDKSKTT